MQSYSYKKYIGLMSYQPKIDITIVSLFIALFAFLYAIAKDSMSKKKNKSPVPLEVEIENIKEFISLISIKLDEHINLSKEHFDQSNREHKIIRHWEIIIQDIHHIVESISSETNYLKENHLIDKVYHDLQKERIERIILLLERINTAL